LDTSYIRHESPVTLATTAKVEEKVSIQPLDEHHPVEVNKNLIANSKHEMSLPKVEAHEEVEQHHDDHDTTHEEPAQRGYDGESTETSTQDSETQNDSTSDSTNTASTSIASVTAPPMPKKKEWVMPTWLQELDVNQVEIVQRHPDFDPEISRQTGVVLSLHDEMIEMGISMIRDLRCSGNQELIQVYHCFPNELSDKSREMLLRNEKRLEIVDACSDFVRRKRMSKKKAWTFRSWWLKPLAVYHTDITEVMLMDADVIPLKNPAIVRDTTLYQKTGTMFFYDRVIDCKGFFNRNVRGHNNTLYLHHWIQRFNYKKYQVEGPIGPSESMQKSFAWAGKTCHEQDSSLVLIDKARSMNAMKILWYLVTRHRFKVDFSWGDKESFWLSFEFAHKEYAFSPWGVSTIDSSTNEDLKKHPDTLCGNMAHWVPNEDPTPELLYVNGKALLEPYPLGVNGTLQSSAHIIFNINPTQVTPRQPRKEKQFPLELSEKERRKKFSHECLVGLGATPLPEDFHWYLLRRRVFFLGIKTGVVSPLDHCHMFEK
jgi:hypothetical protein